MLRNGSHSVIEPRVYRAAFVPALLALVLLAFSLQPGPPPLAPGLATAALFDSGSASGLLSRIAVSAPDRRPGSRGDAAVAARAQRAFSDAGFQTTLDRFSAEGRSLVNVIGRRAGSSTRQIVVVAGRDAGSVPDAATSAADTAALLGFANVFRGTAARHTLVLASLDGETLGAAGARRLETTLGDPGQVDAVVVLSNLASRRSRGPLVLSWSDAVARGNLGLAETAAASLRQELGQLPSDEGPLAQFARLAFPIAPGAQGALLRDGYQATRISGSGELPPEHSGGRAIDPTRYGNLGRGALRLVSALDATDQPPAHGPSSYLVVSGQVLPGWAIRVLAIALIFPALVGSIDALARARRRRQAVGRWFIWMLAAALPFAMGFGAGKLFSAVGLGPYTPAAPIDPGFASIGLRATAALLVTVLSTALAWIVVRTSLIRSAGPLPSPRASGAGCAAAVVLSATAMLLALTAPFAALVLAPAVHLWMLATLTELRPRVGAALAAAGLLPIVALAAYYLSLLSLDPLHAAYYLYLLVAGGQAGLGTTLAGAIVLGSGACVTAILRARARGGDHPGEVVPARSRPRQSILGPGGHVGPGALGGTGSARRP